MSRTTDEWAELLDGTAEGPWETKRHGREEVISICTTVHDPKRFVGDIYGERNASLAAAAPELAAELYRIRYEMEERVRIWRKVTDKLEARGDTSGAEAIRHTIRVVTRILEGDTDDRP